jgi:hypothetical protein
MSIPTAGGHSARRLQRHRWSRALYESEVRVALVAAVCLLGEAIVAKNVLDVHLDVMSQLAAMWVWLVYSIAGRRDRVAELAAMGAAVLATIAVLVVYAL